MVSAAIQQLRQRTHIGNMVCSTMKFLMTMLLLTLAGVPAFGEEMSSIVQVPPPPPPDEAARMARYIVHNADWASVATISSMANITSFPFANTYSVSDGLVNNSSGVPYLFMTPIEMSAKDLARDSRCSLSMTLAQGNYCKQQNLDPEDPRCAHVILTGKIRKVPPKSADALFARNALFTRHPIMKTWPKDHGWFFAKLKIEHICLMDYFGGPKFVLVKDYLRAQPESKYMRENNIN